MALILVDATVGFTEQDSKVAGYAHEQGKACIIVVNKWDAGRSFAPARRISSSLAPTIRAPFPRV